jgi:hypothetical protein
VGFHQFRPARRDGGGVGGLERSPGTARLALAGLLGWPKAGGKSYGEKYRQASCPPGFIILYCYHDYSFCFLPL